MSTAVTFQPRFGKYLLLKRIAKGGMAEIFRALSTGAEGFQKVVAIKRMLPHLSADPEFVDMFISEAKLTSHLNHPNIVHLYDFGIIDELLYHCLEYVQGTTLADVVQKLKDADRALPVADVCTIATEALYGLDQAHRQRDRAGEPLDLIHRDITPSNLLISWEGQIKLVDFGIARATHLQHHTVGGKIKGKFRYMSPEQAHGKLLDQRSDLFSLGICLYELLTLEPMFPELTEADLLERVQQAAFRPPSELNPAIPEGMEAILLRALAQEPDQRFASAAEMRDAVEEFQFQAQLRGSSATLASLMQDLFSGRIQAERSQIAREVSKASKAVARQEAEEEAPGVQTMVVNRDKLPAGWALYDDYGEEDGEDTAELEPLQPKAAAPATDVPFEALETVDEPSPAARASDLDDEPLVWDSDAPDGSIPTPLSIPAVRTVMDGQPLNKPGTGQRPLPRPKATTGEQRLAKPTGLEADTLEEPPDQPQSAEPDSPSESRLQSRATPQAMPAIQGFDEDEPTLHRPDADIHKKITEKSMPKFTPEVLAEQLAKQRKAEDDGEPEP